MVLLSLTRTSLTDPGSLDDEYLKYFHLRNNLNLTELEIKKFLLNEETIDIEHKLLYTKSLTDESYQKHFLNRIEDNDYYKSKYIINNI
jgi:hypothetical protein